MLNFRPIHDHDIPLVQELAGRIWREHYPEIIGAEQVEYMLPRVHAEEKIREERARGGSWFLIEVEGAPCGYISLLPGEHPWEVFLSKLYVLPARHGQGIGRAALQFVFVQAADMGGHEVRLRVHRRNVKALRAYRRAGFAAVAEVVTDFGDGFLLDDYVCARPVRLPAEGANPGWRMDERAVFVEAQGGVAGAKAAFAALEKQVGLRGRRFFGWFKDGVYRACARLEEDEPAASLGLPECTLLGGWYAHERVENWQPRIAEFHTVCHGLAKRHGHDPARADLEDYRSETTAILHVPVPAPYARV